MARIGQLTRQITIQDYTTSKDAYGKPVRSWSAHLSNIWAHVEEAGGSEEFETEQKTARDRRYFTIRFRTGITEDMRILYKSKYYDIDKIDVIEQDKYLKIMAETRD